MPEYFRTETLGDITPSDVSYEFTLYTATGRKLMQSLPIINADWARTVNEVSALTLTLPTTLIPEYMLGADNRIEIWRRVNNDQAYLEGETTWFLRQKTFSFDENGVSTWTVVANDASVVLRSRIVAANDGASQATKTAAADDMMKAVVREQLGASAAAARSISTYLSVQADVGLGPSVTKAFAYQNVLDVLREIAEAAYTLGTPIYFDIYMNGPTMEFRTYKNQRGIDRREGQARSLVVGPSRKNVGAFTITEDWTEEANFIYAIGPSVYGARDIQTKEATSRSTIGPFSRREKGVNGQSENSGATGLERLAQSELYASRPRKIVEGSMRSTPTCIYGRDWKFGDRVTFERDSTFRMNARVDAVQVSLADGVENVQAHFRGDDA